MRQTLSVDQFAALIQDFMQAPYDKKNEIVKALNDGGVAAIATMLAYLEKTIDSKDWAGCYTLIQYINWEKRIERSETTSLLSQTALTAPNENLIVFAIITLSWLQPETDICTELLPLLFDERRAIRQAAIRFFAEMWDERAVPYLEILLDDSEASVQQETMEALTHLSEEMASAEIALALWEKRK